jgi:pimeloyl-ACP methyl ester carboxylesterase
MLAIGRIHKGALMIRFAIPLILAAFAAGAVAQAPASQSSEIAIGPEGHQLHGTLLTAATPAPNAQPALILAGSGPTDRDGNNPLGVTAAPYRLLAEALAQRGITTLRVDKRGIGASAAAAPREEDLRVQTYVDDARAWAHALKARTHARCVWLIGHSEGALHAELAAQDNADICGLVLIAGAGRSFGAIIREQLSVNPNAAPIRDDAFRILEQLEAGHAVPAADVPPGLAALFRPSVQPYVMSMLAADPVALLRSYSGPVLVVQGTTDLQVSIADAQALHGAREGIAIRLIDGMNHVLKVATSDRQENFATYADPNLPLAPHLVDAVVGFMLGH